jgi:hypothetical protein
MDEADWTYLKFLAAGAGMLANNSRDKAILDHLVSMGYAILVPSEGILSRSAAPMYQVTESGRTALKKPN